MLFVGRIAVDAGGHFFEIRCQARGLGNAGVVGGKPLNASSRGERERPEVTCLHCQVSKLTVKVIDVDVAANVERRRNQHGAGRDSHVDDAIVVIG